jgi:Xaa-Pro dipeptidase
MTGFQAAQKAIREAGLHGWLFYNAFHRDEISDLLMDVSPQGMNSRPWACLVRPEGPPVKVVHAIEAGILDHLPGQSMRYVARAEFTAALSRALPPGSRAAAQFSSRFPVCSFLDHGTALLLQQSGVILVPSDDLIVSSLGTLDDQGVSSIQRAAAILHRAVEAAWERLSSEVRAGRTVREGDVQAWLSSFVGERGLDPGGPLLVAAAAGSADPHYMPAAGGRPLKPGDVVQFDIWGKEHAPGAVFGDISWVGVLAPRPSDLAQRVFDAVVAAREAALELISRRLADRVPVSGADVDRAARREIENRGLASGLRHRTGHSIGGRVHGFGVNLDSVEFPDDRLLREGSCFSVEPGVYLEEFGMRTEVDVVISKGRLAVCGGERQRSLLLVK